MTCPSNKLAFADVESAQRRIQRESVKGYSPKRVYACDMCPAYHLTTHYPRQAGMDFSKTVPGLTGPVEDMDFYHRALATNAGGNNR